MSEYDPAFGSGDPDDDTVSGPADGPLVRRAFETAARGFLSSPWPWVAWAVVLPAAALLTPHVLDRFGFPGVLFTWSGAILLGGLVEGAAMLRRGALRRSGRGTLARWALSGQGNLSLVGLALSAALLWAGESDLLAPLWLFLLGHSFFSLGGLAFRPMRTAGVIYQLGGVVQLLPAPDAWPELGAFAVATFLGNLWLAWAIHRRRWGSIR